MSGSSAPSTVEHRSSLSVDDALQRITEAIVRHGMTIFATIDHAANAREAGLTMPRATVLIYGAAKGGTPIMLACPSAALDLPLRVLVREDEAGKAIVAFHPIAETLIQAGVPKDAASRLEPAQQLLLIAAAC